MAWSVADTRNPIGLWDSTLVALTSLHGLMAGTRERVRDHRRRLREQGLRPVQVWVPDVRAPESVAEAHRQAELIAAGEHEADDQAFVDAVSADWSDTETGE